MIFVVTLDIINITKSNDMNSITWKIGGEAGFGIMSAGTMLGKTFSRSGYHILATNEYPSLIRGGHNVVTVRIATERFESMNRDLHILTALNKETVELHKDELTDGALVVFDPHDFEWKETDFAKTVTCIPIPLDQMAKDAHVEPVMRNTIALGATVALLGRDFQFLHAVIHDQFIGKGQEVVDSNSTVAKAGFDYIKTHFGTVTSMFMGPAIEKGKQLILNASEALGIGAARAGLKFAAIYPMTPINALITFLADHAKAFGLVYKQPEDEIAGMMMAIGASISGVRSMVATSGGGFALQVEGLSLAGMIEVPVVIDLGMRVGPATGMPTYTEQGELQFAIHAGHGEFPRIILAPGDCEEIYSLTTEAFNLADRYQIPVFILTDKYLNESQWCVPAALFQQNVTIDRGKLLADSKTLTADKPFRRYTLDTQDGISARTVPGMQYGHYYANSYEHDEVGHVTEKASGRKAMVEKRLKKLAAMSKDIRPPTVYGQQDADITFLSWGSTKGIILEAMKLLDTQGKRARFIHFSWLYPFPTQAVTSLLKDTKVIIDIEQNATGQLASLIREHTGIEITKKLLKYDGRPFFPEDIIEGIATL